MPGINKFPTKIPLSVSNCTSTENSVRSRTIFAAQKLELHKDTGIGDADGETCIGGSATTEGIITIGSTKISDCTGVIEILIEEV